MTNTGRQPRRPSPFNVLFTRQFMTSAPTGGDVTKAPLPKLKRKKAN